MEQGGDSEPFDQTIRRFLVLIGQDRKTPETGMTQVFESLENGWIQGCFDT
jgi:hypothetical protein